MVKQGIPLCFEIGKKLTMVCPTLPYTIYDKAWYTMAYHGISWCIFKKALAIAFVFPRLLISLFLSLLILMNTKHIISVMINWSVYHSMFYHDKISWHTMLFRDR